jgi:hypothetical protein
MDWAFGVYGVKRDVCMETWGKETILKTEAERDNYIKTCLNEIGLNASSATIIVSVTT